MDNICKEYLTYLKKTQSNSSNIQINMLGVFFEKFSTKELIHLTSKEIYAKLRSLFNTSDIKLIAYQLQNFFVFCNNEYMINCQGKEEYLFQDITKLVNNNTDVRKINYFNYNQYQEILRNITLLGLNVKYYQTLVSFIYYGGFSPDLSVIQNLAKEDINMNNNSVLLKPDKENPYELIMPNKIIQQLVALSNESYWQQLGRDKIIFDRRFPDEERDIVFKQCYIKNANGRQTLAKRIRDINTVCEDYNITPMKIYTSGICYRINEGLRNIGLNLKTVMNSSQIPLPARKIIYDCILINPNQKAEKEALDISDTVKYSRVIAQFKKKIVDDIDNLVYD